jgi:hypothetical protein
MMAVDEEATERIKKNEEAPGQAKWARDDEKGTERG